MKKNQSANRRFRYGGLAVLLTVGVILSVILVNVIVARLEQSHAWAVDVNALNATDFDDTTLQVLDLIREDVHVYTVYETASHNALRVQVDSILEKYHALNSHILVSNLDPVTEPARVRELCGDTEVSEGAVIVANPEGSRVKVFNRDDYFGTGTYGSYHFSYLYLERYVTGALVYVTSSVTPHVFFLTGHGEIPLSGCSLLAQSLQTRNYEVASLDLSQTPESLQQNDCLMILSPARDLSDSEYASVRTWLAEGGRMLVLMGYDADMGRLPNLTRLLDYYQLSFGEGVIYENNNETEHYWNGSALNLVPNLDADHEITARLISLGSTNLVLPQARPIQPVLLPESGTVYTNLLTTTPRAFAVKGSESGNPGTQILALAMLDADENGEKEKDIRIVLADTPYLVADSDLLYYCYNLNFTVAAVDWLINAESTVDVSSKVMTNSTLSIPDSRTAFGMGTVAIAVMPLCIVAVGVIVHLRRRRL